MSETRLYIILSGCVFSVVVAFILAINFAEYLLYALGAAILIAACRFAVYPIYRARLETAEIHASAVKLREEARSLRSLTQHNKSNMPSGVYFLLPDERGNYPQAVNQNGYPLGFIFPGNSSSSSSNIPPRLLAQLLKQNVVDASGQQDEEEPRRIAMPKSRNFPLLQQIESGLTRYNEELSVLGYDLESDEPLQVRLFEKENNFVNSLFVIGEQGNGKSVVGTYLAALTVNHGGYILCIDPDANEDQSLSARLGPLRNYLLCDVASTPEEAKKLLEVAEKEIDNPGDYPLILLVDEFSMIMRAKKLGGAWKEVADLVASQVENYATRGRKRLRRAVVFGQISNASRTGGTELRDTCAYIVFNTSIKKAERVLSDASDEDIADVAPSLQPGCAIISPARSSETYIIKFPLPDVKSLQIIADVRAEMDRMLGLYKPEQQDTEELPIDEDLREALEAYENGASGPRALSRALDCTYYQAQKIWRELQEKKLVETD